MRDFINHRRFLDEIHENLTKLPPGFIIFNEEPIANETAKEIEEIISRQLSNSNRN